MRILLFLATNIAIMMILSITFSLFGIESLLAENGVDLNFQSLLIYATVISFSGSFISLFISKFMAKRSMGVEVIVTPSNQTERWLLKTVQEQALKANIGMPEVGIFNHPSPNAFAAGWSRNNTLVAVSTSLLSHMSQNEVEAVLAHEISHVANGDMVTMTLLQGVLNTFVMFLSRIIGHVVDRNVFNVKSGHRPAFWIVSLVSQLILSLLATMIMMWFSRYREFRADEGGASLAGRKNMIAALSKLEQLQKLPQLPTEMSAFAISLSKMNALFSSHPPLAKRIVSLSTK
ncbi:protease HtpX [Colwellia sp. MB3u-55]|uniref:protease HtpX n=1 Tax=Colwellia sp. MB3u-55 TaxID=2759810 RepID=UPI0015F4E62E|nr:protease HtpX [Colwellia sp. MB3u-55]MBA6252096.1 protease HtpX [Colwellia sp. MB3u-55]